MFLRILKSNPILLLVFAILIGTAIWIWSLLGQSIRYNGNTTFFNNFWIWVSKAKMFSVGPGFILLLAEAFIWNSFVNNNTLLKQSSYFPAFFVIILSSSRVALIGLYPSLCSSLFLMLALRRLVASYKKENALANVFDAGLFIGIASLIYPPVTIFILFLWIAILTIRSLIWREWVVAIIGFILPIGFAFLYHFLFLNDSVYSFSKLILSLGNYRKHWSFTWEEWLLLFVFISIGIASFWLFVNKMPDNVVKAQKVWALILWFVLFAFVSVFISAERDARSLVVLVLPVSFVFSNYFLKSKSAIWSEFLFLCLLITISLSLFF